MKHDNDTIVRDICIATGAVTAACIASLATTAKYLFHFCIDTQWKRSVFHQSLIAPERIEKLQQGELPFSVTMLIYDLRRPTIT